jgi:hypothetical protein
LELKKNLRIKGNKVNGDKSLFGWRNINIEYSSNNFE